ncbi:hypothetical protein ACODT3_42665 [Streptomyces sp. 4.24]|uniref:hypothetical protein n=1 Tax=Streptomyces tritrimontium TaxID=3406573 RepID=UPI003BB49E3E
MSKPLTIAAAKAEIHCAEGTLHGGDEYDHLEHLLDDLVAAAIAEHTAAQTPPTS